MNLKKENWILEKHCGLDIETATKLSLFRKKFTKDKGTDWRSISPEYYFWKLDRNPFGKGSLTVAYHENEIIGSNTATWKACRYKGKKLMVVETGDSFTNPDFQGLGINTLLRKTNTDWAIEQGASIVYNTPNQKSQYIARKLSIIQHPFLNWMIWFLPLKPIKILSKRFKIVDHLKFLDYPFCQISKISANAFNKKAKVVDLHFDKKFDDLNQDLYYKNVFMIDRSSAYLNYRLVENPDYDRYGMIVSYSIKKIDSVLIFKQALLNGLNIFAIADWYGNTTYGMRQVWHRAIQHASTLNYDLIVLWAPYQFKFIRSLLPITAVPVKKKSLTIYDRGLGCGLLKEKNKLLFSALDSDVI
jgi:GNAT superfamily N-acetyltransferase